MNPELTQKLKSSIIDGEPELAIELTQQALAEGAEPLDIIDRALIPGMDVVGELFSSGEYFLPNLIISADSMKSAMDLLEPELKKRQQTARSAGKVVMGTVQGDIHEIGKSLVGTMLSANGFTVYDLGADVPVEEFVNQVRSTGATLLGLSALLTTTMEVQREVIEALEKAGLRSQVKVMVGGAPVTRGWAAEIGADGYAEDAIGAVDLAKSLASAA
jgi:corrinoid protein of di/trimethylamine methyltransferase